MKTRNLYGSHNFMYELIKDELYLDSDKVGLVFVEEYVIPDSTSISDMFDMKDVILFTSYRIFGNISVYKIVFTVRYDKLKRILNNIPL